MYEGVLLRPRSRRFACQRGLSHEENRASWRHRRDGGKAQGAARRYGRARDKNQFR